MKNLILFIEQTFKPVLPYKHDSIINNPYVRGFRFISCISIIMLFLFKNFLCSYFVYFLLVISYTYVCYQCIYITIKIYYILNPISIFILKNPSFYVSPTYYNIFYYTLKIFITIIGLPIFGDTIVEIMGDIKYVIGQILFKKKGK